MLENQIADANRVMVQLTQDIKDLERSNDKAKQEAANKLREH